MNTSLVRCAFLLLGLAAAAPAQTAIWTQSWDVRSTFGPSTRTPDQTVDKEVADDFDLVGTITEVRADGSHPRWWNSPPVNLQSATVRFYTWDNGAPGTLLSEQTVPAAQIQVTSDVTGAFAMRIPLPNAFQATGAHFLSVQTLSDLGWSRNSANTIAPFRAVAQIRDRRVGGWSAANASDATFVLYGTLIGPPVLSALADTTLPRSGRLRLFGTGFGTQQGTGEVRIGGRRAFVTRWSDTVIHAYVPEQTPLGNTPVQVVTATGGSAVLPLSVTTRIDPPGRAIWRFQADGHSVGASVVAPDGTVYALDDHDHLYALTPDGGLLWTTPSPSTGSLLTRGPDGTLYTMADGVLRATNADGTHKWDFAPPELNWTISGPTVGPDGNIYATSQYGLGFFSVTPQGTLRWSNPDVGDRVPRGHTIVFSAGQAYVNHTVLNVPAPDGRLQAYDMASGQRRWVAEADRTVQPLIGPGGRIWVDVPLGALLRIYDPDGSIHVSRPGALGMRRFAPDLRRLYAVVPSLASVSAIDPSSFAGLWTVNLDSLLNGPPTPDPLDVLLLARTHTPGLPGSLWGITTDGRIAWREMLHRENGGDMVFTGGPVFALEGDVAYTGTAILGPDPTNPYSYVYAYDVLPAGIARHGTSSAGCNGVLPIGATAEPKLGAAAFAIASGNAPAHGAGAFVLGSAALQQPLRLLGIGMWIDPAPGLLTFAVGADDAGTSRVPLPIPNAPQLVGAKLHAQFVWAGPATPPCPPAGVSATPALTITVQQ